MNGRQLVCRTLVDAASDHPTAAACEEIAARLLEVLEQPESAYDPTEVYYLSDRRGRLLYVGMSRQLDVRVEQHRWKQPWGDQIAHVRSEQFNTRAEARQREAEAIRRLSPIHNVRRETGRPRTNNKLVAALRDLAGLDTSDLMCTNCERTAATRKDDLCHPCYMYRYRNGTDRPPRLYE